MQMARSTDTTGGARRATAGFAALLAALGALAAAGCADAERDGTGAAPATGAATPAALAAEDPAQCAPAASWPNPGNVPVPTITAVPAGAGKTGKPFDQSAGLEAYDYALEEFFVAGTAPAFTTRLVVRRPRDAAKFSGTVFVEWYNVSGGIDMAVLWASSREYFMREGHAFVSVSAQAIGANALRTYDAERYGSIKHPGDGAADAIFSQAAAAIRTHADKLLGPCLPVRAVLAVGQSQSSFRLAQYVNNTHKSARAYDGFLLHSGREPASNDPGVPVFVVLTMNEGNGALADGPNLVKWSVAGATHNDKRIVTRGAEVSPFGPGGGGIPFECANPINDFPSYRVYNAALDGLHRWVREGKRPPAGKPFERNGNKLVVDEHGNARGGVRTQDIDVPVATHGLTNAPKNPLDFIGLLACGLGGTQIPFAPDKLATLYPTHDDYVAKYTAAADAALASGYLLQADRDEAVAAAKAAAIPK